jgi:hypothetical protein
MSVDLFEKRFREELGKVEAFHREAASDPKVWKADFPAWRALFSSLCLYGHSTGYRLFSFEVFWNLCRKAYTVQHPKKERFVPYFSKRLARRHAPARRDVVRGGHGGDLFVRVLG